MRNPLVKRALCGLGLLATLTAPAMASPDGYRPQSIVMRDGETVVTRSIGHDVDGAFARAAELSRREDKLMQSRLETEKHEVSEAAAGLGALRSVAPVEETVFAGCVTRRYLVRYAEGRQRWMLKYRRGVGGWYLADLHVDNDKG